MSYDKERAIAAQNAASAAATVYASIGSPEWDAELYEEIRASVFTHTLGLAGLGEMAGADEDGERPARRSSGGRSYGGGSRSSGGGEDLSEFVLKSGKHRDKTLAEIFDEDPDYLEWAAENLKNDFARKRIANFLKSA